MKRKQPPLAAMLRHLSGSDLLDAALSKDCPSRLALAILEELRRRNAKRTGEEATG